MTAISNDSGARAIATTGDGNQTARRPSKQKAAEHALGQQSRKFENQLTVQTGETAVGAYRAKQFNEGGFFRSVSVANGHGVPPETTDQQSQSAAASNAEADTAQRIAEIAHAFKTMDIETLRSYLANIIDKPPPGKSRVIHEVRPSSPSARVEFAKETPMQTRANNPVSQNPPSATSGPQPENTENNRTSEEVKKNIRNGNIMAQKVAIAEIMARDLANKSQTPVKLALRELDTGVRLVAEVRHLKKEARDTLRNELLSLLALHGLGNYDLQLNGDIFSNRMKNNLEIP